jgi:hypothetical protein
MGVDVLDVVRESERVWLLIVKVPPPKKRTTSRKFVELSLRY